MDNSAGVRDADPLVRARAEGEYHLEYHDEEVARLAAQHEVFLDAMGKLVFAPVDLGRNGLRILDSGTADGRWLVDLRAYLRCKDNVLIGTDSVERMFPPTPPEGISLQVQRVDKPWPQSWLGSFDYVHQRLVLPGCEYCPAATAVKNLCDLVKPGGWVEILEQDHNPPSPGAFERAESMIREIFTVNGFGYDYPLRIKKWLEDAGMQDVRQEVIDVPVGALNPNPEMAQKSTWQISSALAGFLPMARGYAALPLSMPRDQLESLPQHTAEEMKRVGGIQRIYIVYGRKP
ncbi:N-methyltransferase sirN [Metarhizium anisopliae]